MSSVRNWTASRSFEAALPVVVLFVKADGESDGQGDDAGNRNDGD